MSLTATPDQLGSLRQTLLNESGSVPLHTRFRALFTLKALRSKESIDIISLCLTAPDEQCGALLKHELAYVLGQMGDVRATGVLERVLADEREEGMVRHESAEALGAIGSPLSLPILQKYAQDPVECVRETCEIAIDRIKWLSSQSSSSSLPVSTSKWTSVDPAPGEEGNETVLALEQRMMDTSKPLFERYRAMFALRNIGTDEAVDALAVGFKDKSALFRHEVAFIYGQLTSPHSIQHLVPVLQNPLEEDMVRHEAAEALGAIATPEVLPILKEWRDRRSDANGTEEVPRVVRESCEVAVDMWEYENSEQFQYADGLGVGLTGDASVESHPIGAGIEVNA